MFKQLSDSYREEISHLAPGEVYIVVLLSNGEWEGFAYDFDVRTICECFSSLLDGVRHAEEMDQYAWLAVWHHDKVTCRDDGIALIRIPRRQDVLSGVSNHAS